jgi:branched-subunit amino acid transport protein AzlD
MIKMTNGQILITIIVMAVCTLATRAIPFIIFRRKSSANETVNKTVVYLGQSLPYASIGMLVVYCLKDTSFTAVTGFAPQTLGVAATALIYLLSNKSLAAIIGGTATYMICLKLF